jgi:transitional endoplasmic reticulum ATPase
MRTSGSRAYSGFSAKTLKSVGPIPMPMERESSLTVEVRGARKQDAGDGLARIPESVRDRLGVLSGDPLVIEGADRAVASVRLGTEDGAYVRIDGETRAKAGTTVGDEVTLRKPTVRTADTISVRLTATADGVDADDQARAVRQELSGRLLLAGERVDVPGVGSFVVSGSDPAGVIRVGDRTTIDVRVDRPPADETDADVVPTDGDASDGSTGASDAGRTASSGDAGRTDSGDAGGTADTASTDRPASTTGATYEDIGGLDEELDQIREMIELPLSNPGLFERLGVDPPKGVLLYGPPGTGKTLIARAVANEVDAYFDVISGPEIVSKYKGESEQRLREAFERAQDNAPAILFVDELDSIAGTRDEEADMENRVVAQLLTLLDGLQARGRVIVIGATNRVDAVDEALRRGGRFDREIEIGVPDEGGRREILDVHTRGMPLAEDVDLDRIAAQTHGFVGADLQGLATEAAMAALRRSQDEPTVARADFDAAMTAVDPSAMREYVAESPTVTFDDVGGLDDVKANLRRAVEWPLSYGPLFDATKTDPPSGVLLYGPPGTGKTLLARAIAGETGVNFISAAGPELLDRYVGESEKAVRELFERARQTAPTVLFLDEIDAVTGVRGDGEVTDRIVSQLLAELDGIVDNPHVVVLAATNRKDTIDPALLRPGRLESHVEVPLPDEAARREILHVHTDEKPLADDVDLDALAADTDGLSGADLEALVREASMTAIQELADDIGPDEASERADEVCISAAHFERARGSLDG